MRVLVCGGRGFGIVSRHIMKYTPAWYVARAKADQERTLLATTLDQLMPSEVIHGAAIGADSLAAQWAASRDVVARGYPANWYPNGFGKLDRSAGPRRNQKMLDDERPDVVIAFPGGSGTADMIQRAKAAGVPVREITPHSDS